MPLIGARGVSDQSCVRLKLVREAYLSVKLTESVAVQLTNERSFTLRAEDRFELATSSRRRAWR